MDFNVDLWQFLMLLLGGPIAYTIRQNYLLNKEQAELRKEMNAAIHSVRTHIDESVSKARAEFYAALERLTVKVEENDKELRADVHANEIKAKDEFASNKYLKDVEARLQNEFKDVKVSLMRVEDFIRNMAAAATANKSKD